jgi:hypothetical protein
MRSKDKGRLCSAGYGGLFAVVCGAGHVFVRLLGVHSSPANLRFAAFLLLRNLTAKDAKKENAILSSTAKIPKFEEI